MKKRSSSNKIFNFFCIGCFILLLIHSCVWLTWWIPSRMVSIYSALLVLFGFYYLNSKNYGRKKLNALTAVTLIFFILADVWNSEYNFWGYLGSIFGCLVILNIVLLDTCDKEILLNKCTNWLSFILAVSLVFFILHFFVSLPDGGIIARSEDSAPENTYVNYYFFIQAITNLLRFSSVFLEPGHVGTIAVFFCFANGMDFKKITTWVLTASIIASFSLAAYLLYFCGLLFKAFYRRRIYAIKMIISFAFVFGALYVFCVNYNNGDNLVNELIIERMAYDEDNGIVGNNRTSEYGESVFEQSVKNGDIIGGLSGRKLIAFRESGGSAGLKYYLLVKGVIGTVFIVLAYFFIAYNSKNKKWAYLVFLLYMASFFSRNYFFWLSYLIPYICGVSKTFESHISNLCDGEYKINY